MYSTESDYKQRPEKWLVKSKEGLKFKAKQ